MAGLKHIEACGWSDVWRAHHPSMCEYTWYTRGHHGRRIPLGPTTSHRILSKTACRTTRVPDWGEGGRQAQRSDHAAIVFELVP